jgi:LmbE family N-acetylglucosaminyl deacetylase
MISGAYRKKLSMRWSANKRIKLLNKITERPAFGRAYLIISLVVLLVTTLVWSILGAKLQLANADQLINAYLFSEGSVFHNASFPIQHSFLLKWPLFYLIKLFHYSSISFVAVTVFVAVTTIATLTAILYRKERRPLVFGTICLGLASTLLLVPSVPYSGALLPVNMAMLATRNIEYIIYVISIVLIVRAPRTRSWQFALAILVLSLLIASDKLFMLPSIGGAVIGIIGYGLFKRWELVSKSIQWLLASVIATILAAAMIAAINLSGLTIIAGQSAAGPYGVIADSKALVLGTSFAITGLATNFGANPGYNAVEIKQLPAATFHGLMSFGGFGYLINAIMLIVLLYMCCRLLSDSVMNKKPEQLANTIWPTTAIFMLLTTATVIGSFILSNHYYPVDARYLGISLFAVSLAAASYVSKKSWRPEKIVLVGGVLLISCAFSVVASIQHFGSDRQALANFNDRNHTVMQALAIHKVDVLVGDYWRVLPSKLASKNKLNILPLDGCASNRSILSSTAWQPDLHHKRFAYLLSLDNNQTGYPNCSLEEVVKAYGRPNASHLVAGTLSQPKELLLFYDRGMHQSAPKGLTNSIPTVLPITLDEMPFTSCNAPTVMNIVAHQDDDLLFLSPDLLNDVASSRCVRTVYVTAGDSGYKQPYWLAREEGSEAAYSAMMGKQDLWVQRIVSLSPDSYITVANPRKNARISLIFMHLPDGNIHGQGFKDTGNESLNRLDRGAITKIHSLDRQSVYSKKELVSALSSLMAAYHPSEIHTQSNYVGTIYPDHSDHLAVGSLVQQAYGEYEANQFDNRVLIPLSYYIGYPVHELPINLFGVDLQRKESAFLSYAHFDGGVCSSQKQCDQTPTYRAYIEHQYLNPN